MLQLGELEQLAGPVGLVLIITLLPYALQLWKQLTGWEGKAMLWSSVLATYVLTNLLYLYEVFVKNPNPTWLDGLLVAIGMLLYPIAVWAATQGLYKKLIRPD